MLTGPNAVRRALDGVRKAQLAVAQEAARIEAELTAPLRERTDQAKIAAAGLRAAAEEGEAIYASTWAVSQIAEAASARLGNDIVDAQARLAEGAAEAEADRQERLARMIGAES